MDMKVGRMPGVLLAVKKSCRRLHDQPKTSGEIEMRMQRRVKRGNMARNLTIGALMFAAVMSVSTGAHAQAVVMAGNYQNFDVLNNTGETDRGLRDGGVGRQRIAADAHLPVQLQRRCDPLRLHNQEHLGASEFQQIIEPT
jgi:hypothetical protein